MNYRIEEKDEFRIVGPKMSCPWTPEKQEGFVKVPQFWQEQGEKGTIPRLIPLMDGEPKGVMGVTVGDWQQTGSFDYYIAVASSQPAPEGMCEYQVPACTWAVFECKGPMPHAIQKMQQRIMTEWFPNSGYQYADAPDIELYGNDDPSSEEHVCWIWVPVRKG